MKVYGITQEWQNDCEKKFDVLLKGYKTLEEAKAELDRLFEREKEYDWFDETDEDTIIEKYEKGWSVNVNNFDKYIITEIIEIEID